MGMMHGAAEILNRLYADLEAIIELDKEIAANEKRANDIARIDAIRVELYLKRNADARRALRDTVTQIKRLIEEELRPKLQRRAQLDKAGEDALAARVAALEAWRAELERGTLRALPGQRKEG